MDQRSNITFSKYLWTFSLLALWVLVSYAWVPPTTYTFAKTLRFLVYVVPTFWVTAVIIAPSTRHLDDFIVSLLTFYGVILGMTCFAYWQNPASLPTLFGTNYLVTGQTIGLGAVILGAKFLYQNQVMQKSTVLMAGGIITSLFLELHLGGRGPLLSTLLVLGGLGLVHLKNKPRVLVSGLGIIVSIAIGLWVINHLGYALPRSLQRIFSEDGAESLALRFAYYQSAWQCLLAHPLHGIGLGGWAAYYGLGNVEGHPHNLCLEIAAETGLIGLILLIGLLVMLAQKAWRQLQHHGATMTLLLCGLSFCLLNALKSGDINDNIVCFTFAGLIAGFAPKEA